MIAKAATKEGFVEHRLGRTGQDDRGVGDPEQDDPAPPSVTDDVEDRQKHPRDGNEPLRHVDVVDLTQDGSGKRIRGGGEHARDSGELQGAQEDVHADGDSGEHHDLGGHPGRRSGRTTNSPSRGRTRRR